MELGALVCAPAALALSLTCSQVPTATAADQPGPLAVLPPTLVWIWTVPLGSTPRQ